MIHWDAQHVILHSIELWLIIPVFVIQDILKVEYYSAEPVTINVLLALTETRIPVHHVALH